MGQRKGCAPGPGRPKATPESRKQYGKISMSFSITELKVLNRIMRTPWWRRCLYEARCCKCPRREPKCQQVHHVFRFAASGYLDLFLVDIRSEIMDISKQLASARAIEEVTKIAEQLQNLAERLPPDVLKDEPADVLDFASQKAQKVELKELMRVESLGDEELAMLQIQLLQQQPQQPQMQQIPQALTQLQPPQDVRHPGGLLQQLLPPAMASAGSLPPAISPTSFREMDPQPLPLHAGHPLCLSAAQMLLHHSADLPPPSIQPPLPPHSPALARSGLGFLDGAPGGEDCYTVMTATGALLSPLASDLGAPVQQLPPLPLPQGSTSSALLHCGGLAAEAAAQVSVLCGRPGSRTQPLNAAGGIDCAAGLRLGFASGFAAGDKAAEAVPLADAVVSTAKFSHSYQVPVPSSRDAGEAVVQLGAPDCFERWML